MIKDGTGTRLSSILSTITPSQIKTVQKPSLDANTISNSNSMLFEAMNSSGSLNTSGSEGQNQSSMGTGRTTTIQLINANNQSQVQSQQQHRITTNAKSPLIQRIKSFQNNNQPITKTIVSAATSSTTATTTTTTHPTSNNNYKVLTQQLPSSVQHLSTIKPANSNNSSSNKTLITSTNNPIVITKTISSLNEENGKKQATNTMFKNENSVKNSTNISNTTTPITLTAIANSNCNFSNNSNMSSVQSRAPYLSNNINNYLNDSDKSNVFFYFFLF